MSGQDSGPRSRALLLLITLVVAELSSAFEVAMIYAALPTLHRSFGDPIGVGWVISSCLLVSAVAAALCGRLGDLHGRRRILLGVLGACATGSFISASAPDLKLVVVGASIQGLSGAILPLCFGLARELLPRERVAFAIGVIVAAAALGSGTGLVLGGAIVDRFDWSSIFLVSGSVAVLGAAMVAIVIPGRIAVTATHAGIDMLRGILFAPAIAGVLFAVTKARTWGYSDVRTLALLGASLLVLLIWGRHQYRQENPLINVRFFAQRKTGLAYFGMAMIALSTMQVAQVMSIFLQQPAWTGAGFALSATASGLLLLPTHWVGLIASPLSGKIAGRFGARSAVMLGAALSTLGWSALVLHQSSLWLTGTAVFFIGTGFSVTYAGLPNLILEAAPPERTSEATGLAAVIRALFMAIGSQVVMMILASDVIQDPATGTNFPTRSAFTGLFAYVALGCFLCLLAAYASTDTKVAHMVQGAGATERS